MWFYLLKMARWLENAYLRIFLILMTLSLLILLSSFVGAVMALNTVTITKTDNEISDLEFVFEAAERFAQTHNYTSNYDCQDYSHDFAKVMGNLGVKVDVINKWQVSQKNAKGHTWNRVCLDIEPQTGTLTNNFMKYPFNRTETLEALCDNN